MTTDEQLVESNILHYEARQKHIDELFEKASKAAGTAAPEASKELAKLKEEHGKLVDDLEKLKEKSLEDWAKEGGPMVIWDLLAERLEKLVESLEK